MYVGCFAVFRLPDYRVGICTAEESLTLLEKQGTFSSSMEMKQSILKSRDTTLPTKVCLVKAMVFPVVMYGYESWTLKKVKVKSLCHVRLFATPLTVAYQAPTSMGFERKRLFFFKSLFKRDLKFLLKSLKRFFF